MILGIKMKKVLFVVHNLKFGGIQKITVELARAYASLGNEVHIVCLEKGQSIKLDFECQLHTLDMKSFLKRNPLLALYYVSYKLLFRHIVPSCELFLSKPIFKPLLLNLLTALESEKKFDAIFIRGLRSIKRTWWLDRDDIVNSLHLPYQFKTHNNFLMKGYCLRTNRCLFQDKLYFAVSEHITSPVVNMLAENSIQPKKFEAIHNPCNIERVKLLSKENVDVYSGKYILGVGRLTKQKRFDLLIKAYHKANVKDHKLVILGEGNQRCELERLIAELDLVDSVIMPGFVCNPYPWYKAATLFVLSSDCEGFGNVIVEALACGAPVISTNCGPVHEILTEDLSKGLTPPGNYLLLAEKINQYLNHPIIPNQESINRFSFETIIARQLGLIEGKA